MSSVFSSMPRNVLELPVPARGRWPYRAGAAAPSPAFGRDALRLVEPDEEGSFATAASDPSDGPDPLARAAAGVEIFTLEYTLPGEAEPRRASVPFFGRIPGSVLIVGTAEAGDTFGWGSLLGLPMRCRLATRTDVHTFDSIVMHYTGQPSPHLYLRDPVAVTSHRFRQAPRVPTQLPAVVQLAGAASIQGVITNLSEHGAAFRSRFLPGEVGASLSLTFRLTSFGRATTVTMAGTVRSRQVRQESVTIGVQFDPATLAERPNLALLLRSQVYELMLG